ncbi:unnamed protein product, partial [marine sediment metagenome]
PTIAVFLISGTFMGFWVSWYVADKAEAQKWIIILVNIFSVAIVIWYINLLVHTEFLYVEVLKVLMKVLIVAQLLLSFILFSSKRYNYIQISSIFLVLGSVAIERGHGWGHPAAVISYIFTYMLVLRLWFLVEVKRNIKAFIGTANVRNRNVHNLIGMVIFFVVLLGLSWIVFAHIHPVDPYAFGVLPSEFIAPTTAKEFLVGRATPYTEFRQDAGQLFYDSKEKLNRELDKMVDKKQIAPFQKKRLLYFLLELLREDIP